MKIKAPAKINLFLEVVCKRHDLYHEIKTIMLPVDLTDIIALKADKSGRIQIDSDDKNIPLDSSNLAYKAAGIFFDTTGIKNKGLDIFIEKHIPMSAGLGGGSSDAASVLMGLNKMFGGCLKDEELAVLGAQIGCDIPFFLTNSPALCIGKGDEVIPISLRKGFWTVLVYPSKNENFLEGKHKTKEVYEGLNLGLTKGIRNISMLYSAVESLGAEDVGKNLFNRLEEVAFRIMPRLLEYKRFLLESGALGALLSGSGPAVYGVATNRKEAFALKGCLKRRFGGEINIFAVKTLSCHRRRFN